MRVNDEKANGQCLSQCSIAVTRHHDHRNSSKESIELGLAYNYRGLVCYQHDRKNVSMQAGMVLEELRVLHLFLRQQGEKSHWAWLEHLKAILRDRFPPRPQLLQQGHTS